MRDGRRLLEVDPASGGIKPVAPEVGPLDYPFTFSSQGDSILTTQSNTTYEPSWSSPSRAPRRVLEIPLNGTVVHSWNPAGDVSAVLERSVGRAWEPNMLPRVLSRQGPNEMVLELGPGQSIRPVAQWAGTLQPIGATDQSLLAEADAPNHPPELGRLDAHGFRPFTTLDPRLGANTAVEVQRFSSQAELNGKPITVHTGVLLPRGVQRPPAIVWVYPGAFSSEKIDSFHGPTLYPSALYTSRGYAVLACDAPIGPQGVPGEPLRDLAAVVEPQIREAVRLGLIDPDRVLIMGHSHGGYAVGALLAGSKLFHAGVALCGFYDLAAMYCNSQTEPSTFLTGQNRMGVSLWSDPERYRRNSPYALAPQIRAPLLLVAGGIDQACPAKESEKMWNAVRLQHQTAQLAIYPGEEHVPLAWSVQHQQDLLERILRFVDVQLGLKEK